MIDASLSYVYGATAPVVRTWPSLDKLGVVRLERGLINCLSDMNKYAEQVARHGKTVTDKTKAELRIDFVLTEDGGTWHSTSLYYPNMGDGECAYLLGLINGHLDKVKVK